MKVVGKVFDVMIEGQDNRQENAMKQTNNGK